jgi:hypothetical protein
MERCTGRFRPRRPLRRSAGRSVLIRVCDSSSGVTMRARLIVVLWECGERAGRRLSGRRCIKQFHSLHKCLSRDDDTFARRKVYHPRVWRCITVAETQRLVCVCVRRQTIVGGQGRVSCVVGNVFIRPVSTLASRCAQLIVASCASDRPSSLPTATCPPTSLRSLICQDIALFGCVVATVPAGANAATMAADLRCHHFRSSRRTINWTVSAR